MRKLSDNEVLEAAQRIRARREDERAFEALKNSGEGDLLMVRWNVKGNGPGVGYASVPVTFEEIKDIVVPKVEAIIASNPTYTKEQEDDTDS